jgi:gluconokinase
MDSNETDTVYAHGGFAQSSLWLQVLADVFNKKVVVADPVESSALGAVFIGMEALHEIPAISRHAMSEYTPNSVHHAIYARQWKKFGRLYELLKDEFATDTLPAHPINV